MSREGRAYVAPIEGGEWTDIGYVAEFEVSGQAAEVFGGGYPLRSLATPSTLTLRPDDGRDRPLLPPDMSRAKIPPQPGAPVAVTSEGYLVYGAYIQCGTCGAPVVSPFPDGWRMEVHRAVSGRVHLTPHRPDCDAARFGVVIPASCVHDVGIDWKRWAR